MGELTPDMCEDDFLLQRQAVVHLQGRQWVEALEKLQVVLKRNPFCAEAYGLRGCALRPLARYADALEVWIWRSK